MTQKGWLGGIEVWYDQKGITNILSLKTLKNQHNVTYVSKDMDGIFKVHTTQGVVEFMSMKEGYTTLTSRRKTRLV